MAILPAPATLQALAARAAVYATRACSDGTRRTYRSAWRAFEAWCSGLDRPPLTGDPETIAMYAVHAADRGLSLSSLRVALAAIQAAHHLADTALGLGLRHSCLVMLLEGIARTVGSRPVR
ncbi:MAG: integrase [Spirosoma sp.]|nr:integrase [Spirosoma sp.]